MGMRGFIATSEAVFALTLFLAIVMLVAAVHPFPKAKNEAYLRALGMDVLTSFEKSGRLSDGDKNGMKEVLKELPASVCIEVEFEKANNRTAVVKKPGCGRMGNDLIVAYRTYSDGNVTRTALARAWLREAD
ncbi:MAG: hypothetical protein AB1529_02530 [Candidatus Micrarchaeota archaeon]